MGGRIALEVARRVPGRLIGLALLDTGHEALAPGEAGKREADVRHVDDRRREIELPREPRLHGVPVRGDHVQEVVLLEGAHVLRERLAQDRDDEPPCR